MRKTVDILGVPVDFVTMNEAVRKVNGFLTEPTVHAIYTPNAEIMMAAQRDSHLKSILCKADLLVADGAGVVLASKILGPSLPEKVAGFDLVKNTLKQNQAAEPREIKLFLLGGKPGVAEAAAHNILKDYPGTEIMGWHHGYFSESDEAGIIDIINSHEADMLLVALGAPRQEKWIDKYKNQLSVRVCIGVGGTLDVFAERAKLAPDFFRKNGLEWLYRLYKEPWRFKRMLDLPRFIIRVLMSKFKK